MVFVTWEYVTSREIIIISNGMKEIQREREIEREREREYIATCHFPAVAATDRKAMRTPVWDIK